jgi:DeoR/GlpR family transcriptional regulator of sugar metabolism
LGKKSNSDRLKEIIDILRSNNTITTEELSTMLSVSKSTILRDIKFLKAHIALTWVGPKVGGHWEIKE